jgi:hypothetical protein
MKNITKKILAAVFTAVISFSIHAQTNVSGGIYSNTTWSLTGSPYIVTANVVVFPGIILTVQPGVVVKFNSGTQLEIRQAALLAMGTHTDSITFTSNTSLNAGSYSGIVLDQAGTMTSKFNYCNFRYASTGIYDNNTNGDTLIIKNSVFNFNTVGLTGSGTGYGIIDSCNFINNTATGVNNIFYTTLNHCNISYNPTGFTGQFSTINNSTLNHNGTAVNGSKANSINNSILSYNQTAVSCGRGCFIDGCIINHNQTGITTGNTISDQNVKVKNSFIDSNSVTGLAIHNRADSIYNCQIRYNGTGMIDDNWDNTYPTIITKNNIEKNTTGIQLAFTYDHIFCNSFCNNTTYDLTYSGANNINLPNNYWCTPDSASTETVIYDGYDNVSYGLVKFMPINTTCNFSTGISEAHALSFNIFPNPSTNNLTVELPAAGSKAEVKIFNLLGDLEYSSTAKQKTDINVSSFASGIYIIEITSGSDSSRQKFIKQ